MKSDQNQEKNEKTEKTEKTDENGAKGETKPVKLSFMERLKNFLIKYWIHKKKQVSPNF